MPLSSPRLDLPYLEPAQAQKHVTHNEALRGLDLLVQLTIEGFEQTSPPALPVVGQVYALGAAPGGDWAGQPNMLALREENGWRFTQPKPGWLASQAGSNAVRVWTGTAWVPVAAATENLTGVGVNTTPDPINRLAVSAPATLLNHEGSDHRLVINKAAGADTASVLFQSGWTGHAEMGLTGDTGFSVKVSPDGGNWQTALEIDPASGTVQAPHGLRADGQDVIHHGNLLGPVTQSGGAPTGAVIERGSNANGDYVRFADGTQICLITAATFSYYSADALSYIWTFPASYATGVTPVRMVTIAHNSFDYTGCSPADFGQISLGAGNNAALTRLYRTSGAPYFVSGAQVVNCTITAIGRWF